MEYNPRLMAAPKVFLSHASEDKDRFVLQFATQLRARGIDVWLDRWEMHIRIDPMMDGVTHVHYVAPSLKRALES